MRTRILPAILVSLCATVSLGSYCGKGGVPYSFEVLPTGAPVLGCAQPSCVLAPEDGKEDSAFLTDTAGQSDGFFRDGDRTQKRFRHESAPKLIVNCTGQFNELSCPRKNQWVGGIEYIDHPRQPLILQCCSFDGLKFSQEVGTTTVGPGEAITGGEVVRNGRQISFDVIANVRKVAHSGSQKVGYEVTVRRMNCLPDPPEPEVEFDKDVPEEVLKVLANASSKDLGTAEKFEKKQEQKGKKGGKKQKPTQKAAPTEPLPEISSDTNAQPQQPAIQVTQHNTEASIGPDSQPRQAPTQQGPAVQQGVETQSFEQSQLQQQLAQEAAALEQHQPLQQQPTPQQQPQQQQQQYQQPQQQTQQQLEQQQQQQAQYQQQVAQYYAQQQQQQQQYAQAQQQQSQQQQPQQTGGASCGDATTGTTPAASCGDANAAQQATTPSPLLTFPTLPPHSFPTLPPHSFPTLPPHTFPAGGVTFPPHSFPPHSFPPHSFPTIPPGGFPTLPPHSLPPLPSLPTLPPHSLPSLPAHSLPPLHSLPTLPPHSFPTLPPLPEHTFPAGVTFPPHTFPAGVTFPTLPAGGVTFPPHSFPPHSFPTLPPHSFPTHTFPPLHTIPGFGVTPAPSSACGGAPSGAAGTACGGAGAGAGAGYAAPNGTLPGFEHLSSLGSMLGLPPLSGGPIGVHGGAAAHAAPSVTFSPGSAPSLPTLPTLSPSLFGTTPSPLPGFSPLPIFGGAGASGASGASGAGAAGFFQFPQPTASTVKGSPLEQRLPDLITPPPAQQIDQSLRSGALPDQVVPQAPPPQTPAPPAPAFGGFGGAGAGGHQLPGIPGFPAPPPAPSHAPAMGTILQNLQNSHPIMVPGLGLIGYSNKKK